MAFNHEIVQEESANLFIIDQLIAKKEKTVSEVGEQLHTFFYVVNQDLTISYVNPAGSELVGMGNEDIEEIGSSFLEKYIHPESQRTLYPCLMELFKKRDENYVYCDFQRIWSDREGQYITCFTLAKIEGSFRGVLALAQPIQQMSYLGHKLQRIFDEQDFMRKHRHIFAKLTSREKQVMRYVAMGLTNPQIADKLFISRKTVEQHRKNIKRKLEIKTFAQMTQYAQAFDLV
ncbi:MAG: LuxR C-terminal-related transcriptional regulator [Bacteroidota bacterium]